MALHSTQGEPPQTKKTEGNSTSSRSRWDKRSNDGESNVEEKNKVPKIKMGLGKRQGAGAITMKLKPQVIFLVRVYRVWCGCGRCN